MPNILFFNPFKIALLQSLCRIDYSIDSLGYRTLMISHVTSRTSFVEVRLSRLWFQSVVKQTLIY